MLDLDEKGVSRSGWDVGDACPDKKKAEQSACAKALDANGEKIANARKVAEARRELKKKTQFHNFQKGKGKGKGKGVDPSWNPYDPYQPY